MHRSPMRHCPSALPLRLIRALPRPAPGAVAPAVTGRGLTAFSRRSPRQPLLTAVLRIPRKEFRAEGSALQIPPRSRALRCIAFPGGRGRDAERRERALEQHGRGHAVLLSVVICCGTRDSLDHVLAALSPLHHRFLLASLVRPLTRHCSCPPLVLHPFSVPHPLSPPLPPLVVPLAFPIHSDQSDAQRRAVLAAFHAAVALSRGRPAPPLALPLAPPFSPHPAPSLPSAAPPSHGPHATHGPPAFLSPPTHAPLLHSRVGEGEGQAAEVAERGDEGGESGGEEGRGGQGAVVPVVVVTDACLPCGHGGGEAPLGARLLINYDFPPRKDVYLRRVAMCMGQAAASAMQRPEPSASTTATASSSSSSAAGMSLLFVTGGEVPVVRALEDALGTLLHEMPIDVCEALKQ
ncbi:unnamed protein product [Closterium sp. NIES-64]|nr:unnamed protein product [Closterium sp. NIES-64]